MPKFQYYFIINQLIYTGLVKAGSPEKATRKLQAKFSDMELAHLQLTRCESWICRLFYGSSAVLLFIVSRILPIAIAVILIYLLVTFFSD